jgi:hypothetical protein
MLRSISPICVYSIDLDIDFRGCGAGKVFTGGGRISVKLAFALICENNLDETYCCAAARHHSAQHKGCDLPRIDCCAKTGVLYNVSNSAP